jgi:glycosyltransferase involved in cell wall biosynthesis
LRILHCVRAPGGGVLRHIVDLARSQAAAGHAVGIVCDSTTIGTFEAGILDRLAPKLALGLNLVPMRREPSPADIVALFRVARIVARLRPDVLHAHGAKGGAFGRVVATLLRVVGRRPRRVYTPHGGSLHYDPRRLSGRVFFALERVLRRMTDGFVFVSDFERETFTAKVGEPRRPAVRVHNGLAEAEFEPVRPAADAADFVYVGNFRDLKGVDVLIEALALLRDRYGIGATARLIGWGDDGARYAARVAELGLDRAVRFKSPLPTRSALAAGRLLVVPSRAESLPYIVLEAAAGRVPLIATAVGGIPEIFGEQSDRLIVPGDVEALAAAMAAALADPDGARTAADRLARRVETHFSLAGMTAAITGFYSTLLAPGAGRPKRATPASAPGEETAATAILDTPTPERSAR